MLLDSYAAPTKVLPPAEPKVEPKGESKAETSPAPPAKAAHPSPTKNQVEAVAASLNRAREQSAGVKDVFGLVLRPPATPDPKTEATRILKVGSKSWQTDDYPARLDAYAGSLGKGDAAYQKQLLGEVLKQDAGAFQSWLEPEEINRAASSGKISNTERMQIAQTFAGAYNDKLIPSFSNADTGIEGYNFNPAGAYFSTPVEEAKATTEFLNFIDAGGSTPETREFRQHFAQYLTDSYALNDKVPVYDAYGAQVQNHAATLAALVISGDPQHPELAQIFMTTLGEQRLDPFLQHVAAGSYDFTADRLQPQLNPADPNNKVSDIAQPDALSRLASTVGQVQGVDADRLAVMLARAPGDHGDWFRYGSERADAWTDLFNGHSPAILEDLTSPDGLPVSMNGQVEPAFKDRAHDLGAYLRLMNRGDDTANIEQARRQITDHANALKANVAGASTAEVAIDNGRRLGFLGAAATDSVSQAFKDYATSQQQKQALVGFVLDLAISAIPAGDLAKTALGDWFTKHVGSTAVQESLKGFSGQMIDATTGKLTDAAKEHILTHLDEGDLSSLVAKLQESNQFVQESLFNQLPGPGYNTSQTGRENTIQNVNNAYDIALVWLNK
jgi:hypothetical protein